MDRPDPQAMKLDGQPLSDVEDVVQALQEDGAVILKQAANLKRTEDILSRDMHSLEAIRAEVVFNDVRSLHISDQLVTDGSQNIKSILFTGRKSDFLITAYFPMKGDVQRFRSGRDGHWQQMLEADALVGLHCVHLGGDHTVSWVIEVDRDSRQEVTANTVNVKVNGGDMYALTTFAMHLNTDTTEVLFAIIGSNALIPAWRNRHQVQSVTPYSFPMYGQAFHHSKGLCHRQLIELAK